MIVMKKKCDDTLEDMSTLLTTFQGDIAKISTEMEHLQRKSNHLAERIANRKVSCFFFCLRHKRAHFCRCQKAVQVKLDEGLQGLVVPPDMIR